MKKILLVVNNLGCNGSPLYAHRVAKILKRNGFHVNFWSYCDGVVREKIEHDGIGVEVINPNSVNDEIIEQKVKEYDCLISFTVTTFKLVRICENIIPTVWYIHEGQNLSEYLHNEKCKNIFLKKHNIWVVSEYTQQYITETWGKKTTVIHNFVPDVWENFHNQSNIAHTKIRFLMLGNMIERKAFDIAFDAFLLLSEEDRQKCELHYAGEIPNTDYVHAILAKVEKYDNVKYHGVILDEKIYELYQQCDVVVIPSRDEACSLVAMEASMMGKPVIITENVGVKYMVTSENGWVIKTGNVEMLHNVFSDIVDNKYDLLKMGRRAREKYLQYATEKLYEEKLLQNLQSIIPANKGLWTFYHKIKQTIQKRWDLYKAPPFEFLVIPSGSRVILYGAGKSGKKWMERLRKTRYCKVVAWVDKYADYVGVTSLDSISDIKFDYILISVKNRELQKDIKEELTTREIPEEKIMVIE